MLPDDQAALPDGFPEHTENPYASVVANHETAREFLDSYLPDLVSVMTFTWDEGQPLATAYLAQVMALITEQFVAPDVWIAYRALAWELSDHVRAVSYLSLIRPVAASEEADECNCGRDHHLESNAVAAFLDCSVSGDNAGAVRVLDALWKDVPEGERQGMLRAAIGLLTHVVGAVIFSRLHHTCPDHDHDHN